MNQIKKYKTYVIVFFIVFLIGVLSLFKIYICPFYYITGIPCPLCGMTRALFSVLILNFKSSFYYHALWPLVVIFLPTYVLLKMFNVKINKKLENTVSIIIAILFLSYFLFRHITHSEIVEINFYNSLIYKIYLILFK